MSLIHTNELTCKNVCDWRRCRGIQRCYLCEILALSWGRSRRKSRLISIYFSRIDWDRWRRFRSKLGRRCQENSIQFLMDRFCRNSMIERRFNLLSPWWSIQLWRFRAWLRYHSMCDGFSCSRLHGAFWSSSGSSSRSYCRHELLLERLISREGKRFISHSCFFGDWCCRRVRVILLDKLNFLLCLLLQLLL